jgi:hypothetical protein
MNKPTNPERRAHLSRCIRGLRGNPQFEGVLAWFKDSLKDNDKTNRIPGQENKSSEAGCQADFLEIVAACWAPGADRDTDGTGAE